MSYEKFEKLNRKFSTDKEEKDAFSTDAPVSLNLFTRSHGSQSSYSSHSDSDSFLKNSPQRNASPRSSPRITAARISPRIINSKTKKSRTPDSHSPRLIYQDKELPMARDEFFYLFQSILEYKTKFNDASGNLQEYIDDKGCVYNIIVINSEIGTQFFLLDLNCKLGSGGMANVFMAYNLMSGDKLAAKIYNNGVNNEAIQTEIKNLKIMRWWLGDCDIDDKKAVFMQYFPGEDLLDILYEVDKNYSSESSEYYLKKKPLPYIFKIQLARLLLEKLHDIHQKRLIHRDIKTENIRVLVEDNLSIKELNIIDIGNALDSDIKNKVYSSTFFYAPPEICLFDLTDTKDFYSYYSDFFSAGVVIEEAFTEYNAQVRSREKLNEFIKQDERRDLTPEEISSIMPDMYESASSSKIESITDSSSIDKYIYQEIAEKKIKELIASLTHPVPEQRLYGSSLVQEIEHLKGLEAQFKKGINVILALSQLKRDLDGLELDVFNIINLLEPDGSYSCVPSFK